MFRIKNIFPLFLLLFVLTNFTFGGGLYWETKTSGGPLGPEGKITKVYYMPKMFKNLDVEKNEAAVFRLDKKLFITIDYDEKTYSEITFDEMDTLMAKASGQMQDKMADLQKKMETMPEAQRKMMEKMLGDKMPGLSKEKNVEVIETEEKQNISGYDCVKFQVKMDDKDFMAIWTTKQIRSMDKMTEDMKEFAIKRAQAMPFNGSEMVKAFQKIKGFPMLTELMGISSTVTTVVNKNTPETDFEVPEGYKKVESPLLKMKHK
jgi:hypothetical protein